MCKLSFTGDFKYITDYPSNVAAIEGGDILLNCTFFSPSLHAALWQENFSESKDRILSWNGTINENHLWANTSKLSIFNENSLQIADVETRFGGQYNCSFTTITDEEYNTADVLILSK